MAFCIRFKAILYILCFDALEKEHKTYLIDIIDQCCRYRVRARYPVVDWYKYDERRSGHLASVQSAFNVRRLETGRTERWKKQRWLVAWETEGKTPEDWDPLDDKFNIHDKTTYHSDERTKYNIKFNRRFKYAEGLIAGAEQGVFPSGQRKD